MIEMRRGGPVAVMRLQEMRNDMYSRMALQACGEAR